LHHGETEAGAAALAAGRAESRGSTLDTGTFHSEAARVLHAELAEAPGSPIWRWSPSIGLPDDKTPADGFPVDHVAWNLGSVLIVQQRVAAHSYRRSATKVHASPIDHWFISILRSGRSWTEVDGVVVQNEPGKATFRALGHSFWGRTTDAEAVVVYLPRDLFGDSAAILDGANNAVLSGNLAHLLNDYVSSLEASLRSLVVEDLLGIAHTLRDMVTTSLSSVEHKHATEHHGMALMERARRYIRQHMASPDLTPESLCQELGISRTRLYQLFEPSGGVLHYMTRKRLLAAHASLSDPANNQRILHRGGCRLRYAGQLQPRVQA
jgi:hypothetical protein